MPGSPTLTVMVALPYSSPLDWLRISAILAHQAHPACVPYAIFPVVRRGLTATLIHRPDHDLLDVVHHGPIPRASGGRIRRLDLHTHAGAARIAATSRWWTWHTHIARHTPEAKTWPQFLDEHHRKPAALPLAAAREQFETQPRVLQMLAYNTYPAAAHHLDPDRLGEYQAGEAVYVALHWQQSLTGDALIDPHGRWLQPSSGSLADRLRFLAEATRIVHGLTDHDYLIAVRAAPTPDP